MNERAPGPRGARRGLAAPGRSGEPLLHAALALVVSTACLLLAWWTLWPSGDADGLGGRAVLAAPGRVAAPAPVSAGLARPDRVRTPEEGSVAARPPREPAERAGVVVDGWGRPVAGAEVWLDDGDWRLATHTGPDGRFQVEAEGGRLGARHAAHAPSLVLEIGRTDGDARLVLGGPAAGLEVEAVDGTGVPLIGVEIRLDPPRDADGTGPLRVLDAAGRLRELTPAPLAVTGPGGRALLQGLAPGRRTLRAELAGHSPLLTELRLLEGERGRRRLVLFSSARVEGVVRGPDGQPLAGVLVEALCLDSWLRTTTRTDGAGAFTLDGLPAARIRLEASAEGPDAGLLGATAERTLLPGERVDWSPVLEPRAGLRGRLVDGDGAPLEGWGVERADDGAEGVPRSRARTDADGRFELSASPGSLEERLLLYHPLARHGVPSRSVERPAERIELTEDEIRVGVLSGRVVHADGTRPAGALLRLRRLSDGAVAGIRLGDDGSFVTPPLPAGDYAAIFPHHGRGWCPDRPWHVDGHGPQDLGCIVLPARGTLALSTSSTGRAAETTTLRLELLRPGLGADGGLCALDGAVEAPLQLDLAPGRYRVSFPARPELGPREVVVQGGVTTTLALPE